MKHINIILLISLIVGYTSLCQMKVPSNLTTIPKGYLCFYSKDKITVDGKLDEAVWQNADWTDDFVDIEGSTKPKPQFKTNVKMLWDDTYFYIGANLEEPHIWATLKKRDTVIFYDNDFEVFMDPNSDNHEYYEFEINAYNTGWDLFLNMPYKDGGKALDSWNIDGIKTAIHVNGTINNSSDVDKGWSVEIAMPWTALQKYAHRSCPPKEMDKWRINFSRVEWTCDIKNGKYQKVKGKPEDNWVWSPQGVIDMHRPEMWGYVQFTKLKKEKAVYKEDVSFKVRTFLNQIYYAEFNYFAVNKKWTDKLTDLEELKISDENMVGEPVIQFKPGGYVATVTYKFIGDKVFKWHIRQDSKIWSK